MNLISLGKWFWRLFATIHVLWQVLVANAKNSGVLIGAECMFVFSDDKENSYPYYISFSPEPEPEAYFDDYGIVDDSVFAYLGKWTEVITYLWREHYDGWQLSKARLVYALELTD